MAVTSTRRKAAFTLALLIVFFGALELLARRLPAERRSLDPLWLRPRLMGGSFEANGEVPGWDLNPAGGEANGVSYHTNAWRMRGPDYPEPPGENVRRVIVVGDSTPFGVQLPWEETYLAALAAMWEADHRSQTLEIAACAVPGHSSYQSKAKLRAHCLAFHPDLVILANQNSDTARDVAEDSERLRIPPLYGLRQFFQRFALYQVVGHAAMAYLSGGSAAPIPIGQVGGPQGQVIRVPFADYQANLREMVADVRAAGAMAAVLVLPGQSDVVGGETVEPAPLPQYKDFLRQLAREEGLLLFDGPAWFRAVHTGDDFFLDVVHPNAAGSQALAAFVVRQLPAELPRAHHP